MNLGRYGYFETNIYFAYMKVTGYKINFFLDQCLSYKQSALQTQYVLSRFTKICLLFISDLFRGESNEEGSWGRGKLITKIHYSFRHSSDFLSTGCCLSLSSSSVLSSFS